MYSLNRIQIGTAPWGTYHVANGHINVSDWPDRGYRYWPTGLIRIYVAGSEDSDQNR